MESPQMSQTLLNSPPSDLSMHEISERGFNQSDSGNLSTRDELLMSLMASEAAIDSKEFDILSAEEVEDLKKVRNTGFSPGAIPKRFPSAGASSAIVAFGVNE